MTQIKYPEFFDRAPVLRTQDKLAEFLGTVEHSIIEHRYVDAMRLCGHSCPTVTDAYLMVLKGLQALYGTELPQCGEIEVAVQGVCDGETAGATAAVVQPLTGAAPETGLGGIGPHGRFFHRNLLSFNIDIDTVLALRREDDGKTVTVSLDAGMYPSAPEMRELTPRAVDGAATSEELKHFGELWQVQVKAFLLDLADNL